MSIEYKIKEGSDSENKKDITIVKSGVSVEFTLGNIDADIEFLTKKRKELVAQMGLEEAKKSNVTRTHPHIAAMSEEDRVACYLYQQSFAFCKVATGKLEEIDKQLKDYADEKVEILKQTGIVLSDVNSEALAS